MNSKQIDNDRKKGRARYLINQTWWIVFFRFYVHLKFHQISETSRRKHWRYYVCQKCCGSVEIFRQIPWIQIISSRRPRDSFMNRSASHRVTTFKRNDNNFISDWPGQLTYYGFILNWLHNPHDEWYNWTNDFIDEFWVCSGT